MRHQTESGGDVIGHCGCQAAPDPLGQEASVSTPAPPQVSVTAVIADGPSVAAVPSPQSGPWRASTPMRGPIHSPPRLAGSGFRC